MGFYGNITNTSNTTFQFDKIYPNRLAMDANANNDGIFIGRYVLVEYQEEAAYPVAYHATETSEDSGQYYFYSSTNQEEISKIKYLGLPPGEPDRLPSVDDVNAIYQDGFYKGEILQRYIYSSDKKDWIFSEEFYVCVGEDDKHFAIFELIADPSMKSHYIQNFEIDEKHYGQESKGFKGYDSTVWMKSSVTATNGKLITKYVNIADLNSVVPTFDIAADAPTMNPITPHFDADSTNVYYKLHMQSPYGFRVAKKPKGGISDADTVWYETTYDKTQDKTETKKVYEGPADIYYNEAGFSPDAPSVVSNTAEDNYIKLEPTASSGATYSHGAGANDIQEFRLHLPAIGNMMSKAWDIVHGKQRNDYRGDGENASLQGRLDSFEGIENNQIPLKRNDGTIIGSKINNGANFEYHINNTDNEILKEIIPEGTKLSHDDPWIRVNIDSTDLVGGTKVGDNPSQKDNNGVLIQHTYHSTENSSSALDMNSGDSSISEKTYKADYLDIENISAEQDNDDIKLYTPYVDQAGHVVGYNEETITLPYGFKTITAKNSSIDTNKWSQNNGATASTGENVKNIVADDTKDTFNFKGGNKWIRFQTDAESGQDTDHNTTPDGNNTLTIAHETHDIDIKPIGHTNLNEEEGANDEINLTLYDWDYDIAGHITKKKAHTYTLPFGYKTIKTNGRATETSINTNTTPTTTDVVADNTQDTLSINSGNKWVRIDTNATGDSLTIRHDVHPTSTTSNTTDWTKTEANTTIPVPVYSFDNAGHYESHHTESYKLPFGYGKITGDSGSTAATATYDSLAITADDAWLQTAVSKDKVNITHTGPVTGTPTTVASVEPEFGETFNITDWHYDAKGHKYGSTSHTVKMPDGSYTPATSATTHTDIITSLGFTPRTGAITSTKANTDTLTLYNYSANSGNLDIKSTDTINTGLEKIQNHINGLDMSSTSTTDFITSITQTDGKVAVTRAKAGTLVLGTQSTDKTVNADDSLNSAINKLEARIKAEEENRKAAIDTLYGNNGETISEAFDTIKEIADFLEQDDNNKQSGVEKIISDINANAYAIGVEELRATSAETNLATSITTEETRAKGAEQTLTTNLNNEISRAKGAEGTLTTNLNGEITRATNAETTLNTRITNLVGNTSVSAQITAFGNTLGTAAKSDVNDFAPAGYYDDRVLTSVYEAKIASLEGTIAALEARIAALEPQPEPPVSE